MAGGTGSFPSSLWSRRRKRMRSYILIAGTALAISASPALAGGPGGLLGGIIGTSNGTAGSAGQSASGATGSHGNCLCSTVNGLLGRTSPTNVGGMPTVSIRANTLVNSVVGLNLTGRGRHGNGNGQAIGLAGSVNGTANALASINRGHGNGNGHGNGLALAGTVTGTVNAVALINRGHGNGGS